MSCCNTKDSTECSRQSWSRVCGRCCDDSQSCERLEHCLNKYRGKSILVRQLVGYTNVGPQYVVRQIPIPPCTEVAGLPGSHSKLGLKLQEGVAPYYIEVVRQGGCGADYGREGYGGCEVTDSSICCNNTNTDCNTSSSYSKSYSTSSSSVTHTHTKSTSSTHKKHDHHKNKSHESCDHGVNKNDLGICHKKRHYHHRHRNGNCKNRNLLDNRIDNNGACLACDGNRQNFI